VRWGNSLAIRIPVIIAEILAIKAGDDLDIRAASEETSEVPWTQYLDGVYERYLRLKDRVPSDWNFDWLEAAARRHGKAR
jgi:antitoxin MazE